MKKNFAKKMMALALTGAMTLSLGMMAGAEEAEADHVKLAVQMYNFSMGGDWDQVQSQEDLNEMLTQIADAGYEGVEWVNFMMNGEYLDLEETKATLDSLGLESAGMHYHYSADDFEGSVETVVERCKALGCDTLIFAWSLPTTFGIEPDEEGNYTPEQIDSWVEEINRVITALKAGAEGTDIQVLYHNHAAELMTGTSGEYAIDMIEADAKEIDVYWASKGMDGKVASALDYVNSNIDEISLLHVKDGLDGTLATGEMCGWGKGTYDIQQIVDVARENPSIEWVVVENDHPDNFGTTGLEDAIETAAYAAENIDFSYAE